MKIIFLDIDGVVNTAKASCAFVEKNIKGERVKPEQDYQQFDPLGVGLLNNLAEESGAKFVLSSTWRLGEAESGDALRLMKQAGFRHEWLSFTPAFRSKPRGKEIQAWIEAWDKQHPDDPVTHYAIFDDDSDMLLHQMPHFLKCAYGEGISWQNYCDARRILEIWH